jgi:hypothetical protein
MTQIRRTWAAVEYYKRHSNREERHGGVHAMNSLHLETRTFLFGKTGVEYFFTEQGLLRELIPIS